MESVSLDRTSLELEEGDSYTLTATVLPENATDKTVTWTSSNTNNAVVENGKVVAISEGEAIITASSGNQSASCAVTVKKKYIAVSDVVLSKTELTLLEGTSETLTATVYPSDATDKSVTWSSQSPDIASVNSNGVVSGLTPGACYIEANAGDKVGRCLVNVEQKVVPVTGISLNKASISLNKGESETLVATITPEDATNKEVTWTSDNTGVASVDQQGTVLAKGAGNAKITATIGEYTAECTVKVSVPVQNVTLNYNSISIVKGRTKNLTATVSPSDATYSGKVWSSSDESVATVSTGGVVTAIEGGKAVITVDVDGVKATCDVEVIVHAESVSMNKTDLEMYIGDTETLTFTVSPANTTDQSATWTSSNTNVATVDENGKVTALSNGSTKIYASVDGKTASCNVKVYAHVESITLNKTSLTMTPGETEALTATITPSGTKKEKIWSSSDADVATVDQNGLVTAVGVGTAVITVKSENFSATCEVTVFIPTLYIVLNATNLTLKTGQTYTLQATVYPEEATNKAVNWSSSNKNIISVDSSGKITAIKEGTATIYADAADGYSSTSCTVKVSNSSEGGHEGTGFEEWD